MFEKLSSLGNVSAVERIKNNLSTKFERVEVDTFEPYILSLCEDKGSLFTSLYTKNGQQVGFFVIPFKPNVNAKISDIGGPEKQFVTITCIQDEEDLAYEVVLEINKDGSHRLIYKSNEWVNCDDTPLYSYCKSDGTYKLWDMEENHWND